MRGISCPRLLIIWIGNACPGQGPALQPLHQGRIRRSLVIVAEKVQTCVENQVCRVIFQGDILRHRLSLHSLKRDRDIAKGLARPGGAHQGRLWRVRASTFGRQRKGRPGKHIGRLPLAPELGIQLGNPGVITGEKCDRESVRRQIDLFQRQARGPFGDLGERRQRICPSSFLEYQIDQRLTR